MPITSVASAQLALLKTTASQGSNGVARMERSAIARTKNAIGTTTRFANNEIGVTRWKYHRMNGSEPAQAASETLLPRHTQSKAECIQCRSPRTSVRGKKGSGALQRCNNLQIGSATNTIAPTTANESWNPVEKSSFVSQQRRKTAAAARLLRTKTFRSKNKPPSRIELITAARTLETWSPVTAA